MTGGAQTSDMTILYTHDACLKHDMGPGHPEQPARLRAILDALAGPDYEALDRRVAPRATEEQIAAVHPARYVEAVLAAIPEQGLRYLDGDTSVCPGSGEAALRAAGSVIAAVDAVMAGEDETAFCAIRPPGHHAEPDHAMGFCLFNNVAIGAAHARDKYGLKHIAVVDFDVHHGNGTQTMFENEPHWFYGSIHQSPLYPGTGHSDETGVAHNIQNLLLPPMAGSTEFRVAAERYLLPSLLEFRPDLVFISAGFDAHAEDPLAQLNLQDEDYEWITKELKNIARQTCDGRIVSVLEGGYDLNALARAAAVHVKALMAD